MSIPRFRVTSTTLQNNTLRLDDPAEVHHALRVLRLKRGDPCIAFDGMGTEYHGRVAGATAAALTLRVDRVAHAAGTDVLRLTLVQGMPKLPAFEEILQHATELGVTQIQPIVSARSVVRLTSADWPRKQQRWGRILAAAAKQCQRSQLPELLAPQRWTTWIAAQQLSQVIALMPTLAIPTLPLASVLTGMVSPSRSTSDQRLATSDVMLCVGPEGDFTPEEARAFVQRGGHVVSLGKRILRAPTAALATLAILQHEWSKKDAAP